MSTRIGGPHRCNIHPDFPETDDVKEWNKHCEETEGHETVGHVPCSSCGADIDMGEVPYQLIGVETRLQCPNCYGKTQDLNKLILERSQEQSQQQEQEQQGGNQQ